MDIKPTLIAISNDARGWLKVWAQDFSEAEARLPGPASRAPNPLAWQLGHIACVEDEVAQLFTSVERPEPLVHENYHVGEIAAVRKALGKARIG